MTRDVRKAGENGGRSPDKESRCVPRGRREEKRETLRWEDCVKRDVRKAGENGGRSPDKESRCVPRGRREEKKETAMEMGGLFEKECRSRRKLERKSS